MLEKIIMAHLDIESLAKTNTNYKGKLLAWSQKVKNKVEYKVSDEIIINNRKQYVVKLYIEDQLVSEGCIIQSKLPSKMQPCMLVKY